MEAAEARRDDWRRVGETDVFVDWHNEKVSHDLLIGILNAAGIIPADPTKLFDATGGKNVYIEFGNSGLAAEREKGRAKQRLFAELKACRSRRWLPAPRNAGTEC